jgi:hypothetical protein
MRANVRCPDPMLLPLLRIACDTIPYRKGFVEVARVNERLVNLEAWEVSAEWKWGNWELGVHASPTGRVIPLSSFLEAIGAAQREFERQVAP